MAATDLRYAARTLAKSPVFLVTAVVTIALGVGATMAIFSVIDAVLLQPLPYKDPARLVLATCDMRTRNIRDNPDSNENFLDLRNGAKTQFEDLGAVSTFRNIVPKEDGTPEQVAGAQVTTNFFRLVGAKIILGRDFTDADGQPQPPPPPPGAPNATQAQPRAPNMVILSYEYWQRRYGGGSSVLGRTMPNGGQIVGVLAPRFELFFPPSFNVERSPDMWFAARVPYNNARRNGFFWRPVGRLREGATLDRARSEAELMAADIRRNFPIYGTGGYRVRIEPMHQYMVAEVRPAILALMGAVIFLLLIACANVGNLLLVRASLRERELAVRAALGGNRWRLARQMLVEAVLLAAVGTMVGLGLAWLGIHELLMIAPANLPRLDTIKIDPLVLGFTVLTGLAAAAIFGITPALRASRTDVMGVLRGSSRTAGLGSVGALRNVVVVSEVTLSFVLLVGSGLMFRSFLTLQHIDLGFDPHQLLTFQQLGGRNAPVPQQRAAYMREIRDRLKSIPGVESVTAATNFPFSGGFFQYGGAKRTP